MPRARLVPTIMALIATGVSFCTMVILGVAYAAAGHEQDYPAGPPAFIAVPLAIAMGATCAAAVITVKRALFGVPVPIPHPGK